MKQNYKNCDDSSSQAKQLFSKPFLIVLLLVLLSADRTLWAYVIDVSLMSSGPLAPMSVESHITKAIPQSAKLLAEAPTSSWTYGCSPTAAGMIFGYYDRISYSNMYSGPANGGLIPLTDIGNQSSIIVTQNGFDGRTTNGHVDDYWISNGSTATDPWEGNWAEHAWEECTADFMGSNQLKWDFIGGDGVRDYCRDGTTALFAINGPQKLYDYIPPSWAGVPQTALSHGMRLFAESRGCLVIENYTQKIDTLFDGGFSFADYIAEIDAGFPVMIQLSGHSMVGVGYDALANNIYLHDGWGDYLATMAWGGTYGGMDHIAMTAIHLDPVPEPATVLYFLMNSFILSYCRRKHHTAY